MNELTAHPLLGYRAFFVYGILIIETALHIPVRCRTFSPLRVAAGGTLFLGVALLFPDFTRSAVLGSTLIFFASVLLFWFVFQNTLRSELYLCVSAYILQNMALGFSRIVEVLLGLSYIQSLLPHLICMGLAAAVGYGLLIRHWKIHQLINGGIHNEHSVLLTAITSICIIVTLNTLCGNNDLDYNVFARIAIIASCCFALSLQHSGLRASQLKMENQTIQQLLAAERGQYQISKESIDIINMKCHDLKHQIAAMRAESRLDQQSALQRIEDAANIYDAVAQTGNEALDAVLTEKILYCKKHGISLNYMVDQTNLSILYPLDLYALFGNAIDNAIESVMKEDEDKRIILLNICQKCGFLSIHLENYCKARPAFQDGLPQTTKKDTRNHGFGVRSIRYLAEQYGGHTVFRMSRNMFSLDITIPIPD